MLERFDWWSPAEPSALRGGVVAGLCLASAILLRSLFDPWLEDSLPYATFFPAVMVGTLLGGTWAGAIVFLLGGVFALMVFGGAPTGVKGLASLVAWLFSGGLVWFMGLFIRRFAISVRVKEAELQRRHEQMAAVLREMEHRAKNTFAVIHAIASLSSRHASSVDGYREQLLKRINALAEAHELLSGAAWSSVDLESIVTAALKPFLSSASEQLQITSGSRCKVNSGTAVSLALVLHELATNALKYGALSVPQGKVSCTWKQDNDLVQLYWLERAGPTVITPARRGFGTQLLSSALLGDAAGSVDVKYEPEGVECVVRFNSATDHHPENSASERTADPLLCL
jgi:two-component sensor histidine kinase